MSLSAPAVAAPHVSTQVLAADTDPVAVHQVDSATRLDAGDYWSEQRMRSATPMVRLLDRTNAHASPAGTVKRGLPALIQPTRQALSDLVPLALAQTGATWSGGGAVTKTAGRVFFNFNGADASCSGDAVTSGNRSVVITAGHCVKYEGTWHTSWVFVPGYDDGDRPHGTWRANTTLTTPQWEATEDLSYDVGAAVVDPLSGQRLTDAVGGQGIAFNQDRGQTMYSFGYPAADPYDGESLIYCSGTTIDDPLLSTDLGLPCDMTGGSSGGPWFLRFDEESGAGVQNSVNSFGYVFLPDVMFGPYFGSAAKALYDEAASR
ncbi:MAG: trypsin-like serine peptidase [Actinopolymorphaceae bacterium]